MSGPVEKSVICEFQSMLPAAIETISRLEALKGVQKKQHSIRINDQWRICFIWDNGIVNHVDIVDYH